MIFEERVALSERFRTDIDRRLANGNVLCFRSVCEASPVLGKPKRFKLFRTPVSRWDGNDGST